MKRYRYLGDPLFLLCSSLYALNRWVIKPRVHSPFMHNHFNDVLLIPCALPPLLLLQRWLKLRSHDQVPTCSEIGLNLLVWSVLFEWLGPHIIRTAIGDPWDVLAYCAGGVMAGLWWHRREVLALWSS